MRETLFFVASLAGAAVLTALAILVHPESFWKWVLWIGTGVFIACALVLLIDLIFPGRRVEPLVGMAVGVTLLIVCGFSFFSGTPASREKPIKPAAYAGVLVPKEEKLLFPPTEGGPIPKIQIGESHVFIVGPNSPYAAELLPALSASQLKVESVGGKMQVSTRVADGNSNLIAELIRNEWKVAPQPHTWDRNYSDDALEVKDPSGRIVLQVRVLPDRIQIQGLWWIDMGPPNGIRRLIVRQNPEELSGAQLTFVPKDRLDTPPIRPMFEYPSELHLGELRATK
jgi:hypothetical protein